LVKGTTSLRQFGLTSYKHEVFLTSGLQLRNLKKVIKWE